MSEEKPRPWFRFGLRTLFALIAICALLLVHGQFLPEMVPPGDRSTPTRLYVSWLVVAATFAWFTVRWRSSNT